MQDVTVAQPLADILSTPVLGSASILCMQLSATPISAREGSSDRETDRNPSHLRAHKTTAAIRNRQKGAGYLKPIVWTLILVSGVYVAVKVIPVLADEYEFQDSMQTIARNGSATGQPAEKIRDAVLKEAEKDELPVASDDIKIDGKGGNVRINVDYSVTVDLGVYQWTFNFHPAVSNNALL
jgi:hypothetical protein